MSELEEEVKGCRRESVQEMSRGWGFEGRPQASRARGRVVCRWWTEIWEWGSRVLRRSSWGVRRGGIFAISWSEIKMAWKYGREGEEGRKAVFNKSEGYGMVV